MHSKVFIKDLFEREGEEVRLKGWVCQFRSSGKISFLVLRDGTGECQCVFSEQSSEKESLSLLPKVSLECSVHIEGKVKKWKQGFEIEARYLKILSPSPNYPIAKKSHGVDFLLKHRHLWLRSKRQRAILQIRNEITQNIHRFFGKEGFVQVDTPIFMPTSSEGTGSLFPVRFFGDEEVFLSQSGQLHAEAAAAALGRVYSFGPTFRAEKSSTRRHLLEFWMIEPEMAFCSYQEAMSIAEDLVEFTVQKTISSCQSQFEILKRDLSGLKKVKKPFPRISYSSACEILKTKNPDFIPGKDFGGTDETILSEAFDRPVFVHHYPKNIKAFYMKEDPDDPRLSLSFDLLGTESCGELIGGSQREDDLEILKQSIKTFGLNEKHLNWYLDLRRFGSFPHSGFGLGLERLVSWLCHLDHVREAIPFPRLYGRTFFEKN